MVRAGPVLGVACLLAAAIYVRHRLEDPSISLLVPESGAQWIRYPDPFLYMGRPAGKEVTLFRTALTIGRAPSQARLTVRGFKIALVQVDRIQIGPRAGAPERPPERWKEALEIDLPPDLSPGTHELQIAVLNANGHACVLAHCAELGLKSDSAWEASHDGNSWTRAVNLAAPESLPIWREIPSAREACGRQAWWLIPLFLSTCAWTFARARGRLAACAWTPSRVRWLLIAAWVLLAANNVLKIPLDQGFDHDGHMEYVRYVAERGRLPLANEGWEMFQAPLYYVLTALLQRVLALLAVLPVEPLLRLLPLACGALQVEIAYRTVRHAFRDRDDLQSAGIWIAGLLPMSLYVSQVVGNEPLGGITAAIVALLCVKTLCSPDDATPFREAAWIGLALGIALLSKMSAVLWIPLAGAALVGSALARGRSLRAAFGRMAIAWAVAGLIAGWYYARNWIELGKPLVGNWDWKAANRIWWQDPGYRIPQHFTRFGRSIVQPVYAAVHGFWDAMYSTLWADGLLSGTLAPPPWNLESMLAGAWLGLPITAAIAAAILVAMLRAPARGTEVARRAQRFAALAVLVTFAGALNFYLTLPIYSCAKATYTLGLVPCYALLAAAGLGPLLRTTWSRALVNGWLVCLGVASYAAYFVL